MQLRIRLLICGLFAASIAAIILWRSRDIRSTLHLSQYSPSYEEFPSLRPDPHPYLPLSPGVSGKEKIEANTDTQGFLPLQDVGRFCGQRRFKPYENRSQRRKIYDLVLINSELDWLDIRLGHMYPYIDYFVILEAEKTFTDTPKTLAVEQNWDRFSRYHDKMIRHTLNETGFTFTTTWEREKFSRNAIYDQVIPYLAREQKANIGDVLLVADVDELPRPDALQTLRNCEFPEDLTLGSRMYYYSFQWLNRINSDWPHPQATFYKGSDKTITPENLRTGDHPNILYNAGWHCSYCFSTLKDMVNKVTSFSHTEYNKPEFRDQKKILQRVRSGLDIFDRGDSHFDRVEDNEDVPQFLKDNREIFNFVLDRDPKSGNFRDYGRKL